MTLEFPLASGRSLGAIPVAVALALGLVFGAPDAAATELLYVSLADNTIVTYDVPAKLRGQMFGISATHTRA